MRMMVMTMKMMMMMMIMTDQYVELIITLEYTVHAFFPYHLI
jgi:hypothetical protein